MLRMSVSQQEDLRRSNIPWQFSHPFPMFRESECLHPNSHPPEINCVVESFVVYRCLYWLIVLVKLVLTHILFWKYFIEHSKARGDPQGYSCSPVWLCHLWTLSEGSVQRPCLHPAPEPRGRVSLLCHSSPRFHWCWIQQGGGEKKGCTAGCPNQMVSSELTTYVEFQQEPMLNRQRAQSSLCMCDSQSWEQDCSPIQNILTPVPGSTTEQGHLIYMVHDWGT